jgi:hypothetical protein
MKRKINQKSKVANVSIEQLGGFFFFPMLGNFLFLGEPWGLVLSY